MRDNAQWIAVVGMAGRFAGSDDINTFWDDLCAGRGGIRRFSRDELLARGVPAERIDHPDYVPMGAKFDGIDLFDAAFFDFTPREAEVCGPQQRLLLECAHRALEDAGCAVDKLEGRVGTFVGVGQSNYLYMNLATHPELAQTVGARTVQFGNDNTFAATQIAYRLNLQGPAISVATACSTSLVAIHLARKSLLDFECDVAIAGGAQVSVEHDCGYMYHEGGIHSPDGHCRTFDADAAGTVSGNGVGVVVLRRLQDALDDGDRVIAVLRSSALSNDGNDKVGYSAPSVRGQAVAIAEAHAVAGVHPDQVGYIEAHGTATPLGDPIEIAALTDAFRLGTERSGYCAIGSLKSNLGHMGAGAGVGGFIKAALVVQHGHIPPSLYFKRANPSLQIERTPFFVNAHLRDWDLAPEQRIAGVSSFGMGGTNAHAILSGIAPAATTPAPRIAQPILLSAKNETALLDAQRELAAHLIRHPEHDIADVAYTLASGRRDHVWRRAIVADDRDALIEACGRPTAWRSTGCSGVVFMFPGQGSQHAGMAARTYAQEPAFRAALDRCADALRQHGVDPLAWVTGDGAAAVLDRTAVAQPVLFAIEYAYAQLWLSRGVTPVAMIGHSLGEYVAATLAGVFELDAALMLVRKRGELMQAMAPGAMLAVAVADSALSGMIGIDCELAAINAPDACVLSGSRERLQQAANALEARGIASRWLAAQHAFHSAQTEPMLDAFRELVRQAAPNAPARAVVSNVTGTYLTAAQCCDPDYWAQQVRGTVRFAQGLAALGEGSDHHFLEVGPGQVLSGLAKRCAIAPARVTASAPNPGSAVDDARTSMAAAAELWVSGETLSARGLFPEQRRRKLPLPGHPLQRQRHWIEPQLDPVPPPSHAPTSQAAASTRAQLHAPTWRQLPLCGRIADGGTAWIVLADDDALSAQIVARLRERGAALQVLRRAASATAPGDIAIELDRSQPFDVLDVAAAIGDATTVHVMSLWRRLERSQHDALDELAERGLPLLRLLETLAPPLAGRALRISTIGSGCHALADDEAVDPSTAAAWAAIQIAGHEYPETRGCQIDIGPSVRNPALLADAVLAEHAAGLPEPLLAWRGGRRHVREFVPVDGATASRSDNDAALADGAVWLITGGLGGIGLVLARHLARTFRARLVLVGRTPLPARQEWNTWLATQSPSHRTSRSLAALREIEADGSEVLVLAADVSNRTSMQYVADRAKARFGRVDGIVHAAGVADMHPLQGLDTEVLRRGVSAKVSAMAHLHALFGDTLRCMLLCSSQNAFKGGIGKYTYCAANAYLDAWADAHASSVDYRLVSLNWCTWSEVGMAVASGAALEERRQTEAISNAEAMALFDQAIRHPLPRLVVSRQPLAAVLAEFDDMQRAQRLAMAEHAQQRASGNERPATLGSAYVPPASLIERQLCEIWTEVLGIDPVGVLDNFFELGGSSLLLTQVSLRVKQRFAGGISLQGLFAALTVREQAAHVIALQADGAGRDELDAMLAELEALSDDEIAGMLNA